MTFYLTFGQKNTALKDGWIEIEAPNEEVAREIAFDVFGQKWASLYTEEKFYRSYFPAGKIGPSIVA